MIDVSYYTNVSKNYILFAKRKKNSFSYYEDPMGIKSVDLNVLSSRINLYFFRSLFN